MLCPVWWSKVNMLSFPGVWARETREFIAKTQVLLGLISSTMLWGDHHFLLSLTGLAAAEEEFGVSVGWAAEELPAGAGHIFPAAAAASPRLFPVLARAVLRSVNGIARCLCWPPSSSASQAHPPAFLGICYLLVAKRAGNRGRGRDLFSRTLFSYCF